MGGSLRPTEQTQKRQSMAWPRHSRPLASTSSRNVIVIVGNRQRSSHCTGSEPDRNKDLCSVVNVSDFYSVREGHSTGMYRDLARPQGLENWAGLCLSEPPGPDAGPGRTVRLFGPTSSRPTTMPNAGGAPFPTSLHGSGICCS